MWATNGIGERRRVNLIVGFWVSASRRHRVCFDDEARDEGTGTCKVERGENDGGGRAGRAD